MPERSREEHIQLMKIYSMGDFDALSESDIEEYIEECGGWENRVGRRHPTSRSAIGGIGSRNGRLHRSPQSCLPTTKGGPMK
jgi:hypothetical protein